MPIDVSRGVRASGHLQVKGPRGARRYYTLWRDTEGRHQRLLGPAHVKDSSRPTPRGAVIWRSADGPKPGPEWLTPDDAAAALRSLLAGAPTRVQEPSAAPTFAEVCEEWMRHGERERQLKPSTLLDYRSSTTARILPALGDLRVDAISSKDLEAWREGLLAQGELSHRTINKLLMIVGAVLERARRRGVIAENPARDLDKLKEPRYDDLDFYDPDEVWRRCGQRRHIATAPCSCCSRSPD